MEQNKASASPVLRDNKTKESATLTSTASGAGAETSGNAGEDKNDDDREEGEIVDDLEFIMSSDDENVNYEIFSMRQRIQELEAKNEELEKIARISGSATKEYGYSGRVLKSFNERKSLHIFDSPYNSMVELQKQTPDTSSLSASERDHGHKKHKRRKQKYKSKLKDRLGQSSSKCNHRSWENVNSQKRPNTRRLKGRDRSFETINLDSCDSTNEQSEASADENNIYAHRDNLRLAVRTVKNNQNSNRIPVGSLRERLVNEKRLAGVAEKEIRKTPENDESKNGGKDKEQHQEEQELSDDSEDLEVQELRLIALKSAVMKKHFARKQRNEATAYSPTDFEGVLIDTLPNEDSIDGLENEFNGGSPIPSPIFMLSPQQNDEDTMDFHAVDTKPVDMDIANSESDNDVIMMDGSNHWIPLSDIAPPPPLPPIPQVSSLHQGNGPLMPLMPYSMHFPMYLPDLNIEPPPPGVMAIDEAPPPPPPFRDIDIDDYGESMDCVIESRESPAIEKARSPVAMDEEIDELEVTTTPNEDHVEPEPSTSSEEPYPPGCEPPSTLAAHLPNQPKAREEDSEDEAEALRAFLLAKIEQKKKFKGQSEATTTTTPTHATKLSGEVCPAISSSVSIERDGRPSDSPTHSREPTESILKEAVRRLTMRHQTVSHIKADPMSIDTNHYRSRWYQSRDEWLENRSYFAHPDDRDRQARPRSHDLMGNRRQLMLARRKRLPDLRLEILNRRPAKRSRRYSLDDHRKHELAKPSKLKTSRGRAAFSDDESGMKRQRRVSSRFESDRRWYNVSEENLSVSIDSALKRKLCEQESERGIEGEGKEKKVGAVCDQTENHVSEDEELREALLLALSSTEKLQASRGRRESQIAREKEALEAKQSKTNERSEVLTLETVVPAENQNSKEISDKDAISKALKLEKEEALEVSRKSALKKPGSEQIEEQFQNKINEKSLKTLKEEDKGGEDHVGHGPLDVNLGPKKRSLTEVSTLKQEQCDYQEEDATTAPYPSATSQENLADKDKEAVSANQKPSDSVHSEKKCQISPKSFSPKPRRIPIKTAIMARSNASPSVTRMQDRNVLKSGTIPTGTQLKPLKIVKPNKVINTAIAPIASIGASASAVIKTKYSGETTNSKRSLPLGKSLTGSASLPASKPSRLISSADVSGVKVQRLVINLGGDSETDGSFEDQFDNLCSGTKQRSMSPDSIGDYRDIDSPFSLAMDSPDTRSYTNTPTAQVTPLNGDIQSPALATFQDEMNFERKVAEFLKSQRTKAEAEAKGYSPTVDKQDPVAVIQKTASNQLLIGKAVTSETASGVNKAKATRPAPSTSVAVCHLPTTAQEEYHRLVLRMKMLERQKQAKKKLEMGKRSVGSAPREEETKIASKTTTAPFGANAPAVTATEVTAPKTPSATASTDKTKLLQSYESSYVKISSGILAHVNQSLVLVEKAKEAKISKLYYEKRAADLRAEMEQMKRKCEEEKKKIAGIFPSIMESNELLTSLKKRRVKLFQAAMKLGKTLYGEEYRLHNDLGQDITVNTTKLANEIKLVNSIKYQDIGRLLLEANGNNANNNNGGNRNGSDHHHGNIKDDATTKPSRGVADSSAGGKEGDQMETPKPAATVDEDEASPGTAASPPPTPPTSTQSTAEENPKRTDVAVDANVPFKDYESPLVVDNKSAIVPNPFAILCRYSLHGNCQDDDCPYTHLIGKQGNGDEIKKKDPDDNKTTATAELCERTQQQSLGVETDSTS